MIKNIMMGCITLLSITAWSTQCMNFEVKIYGQLKKGYLWNTTLWGMRVNQQIIACTNGNAYYLPSKDIDEKEKQKLNIENPTTKIETAGKELHDFLQEINPNKEDFELDLKITSEGETKSGYYTEVEYIPYTFGLWCTIHKKKLTEKHFQTLKNIAWKLYENELNKEL